MECDVGQEGRKEMYSICRKWKGRFIYKRRRGAGGSRYWEEGRKRMYLYAGMARWVVIMTEFLYVSRHVSRYRGRGEEGDLCTDTEKRGKEGRYQILKKRGGRRCVQLLKKREGMPVSHTKDERRKEMRPQGRKASIRY